MLEHLSAEHRLPFDNLMNEDCIVYAENIYTSRALFKHLYLYQSKRVCHSSLS
jgi:hypothetical protein